MTLNDRVTIENPIFVFQFIDIGTNVSNELILADQSTKVRYNLFNLTEGTDVTLNIGEGDYKIYETDDPEYEDIDSLDLLETGIYKVITDTPETDIYYIPGDEVNNIDKFYS